MRIHKYTEEAADVNIVSIPRNMVLIQPAVSQIQTLVARKQEGRKEKIQPVPSISITAQKNVLNPSNSYVANRKCVINRRL